MRQKDLISSIHWRPALSRVALIVERAKRTTSADVDATKSGNKIRDRTAGFWPIQTTKLSLGFVHFAKLGEDGFHLAKLRPVSILLPEEQNPK